MKKQIIIEIEDNELLPFETIDKEHIKSLIDDLLSDEYNIEILSLEIMPS